MAAGIYNFTIEQGTTFQRTFKYKDASGNPLDLSDHDVRMQIRSDKADNTTSFLHEFGSGSEFSLAGSGGLFIVSTSSAAPENTLDQFTAQILGYNALVPTMLEEFYQKEEDRFYKSDQG